MVMATSIEFAPRWWILRARTRNPLVRAIDRLELLIIALGFVAVLVTAACAGALGTAVYDARSRVYIAQAQTTHAVTGTAIEDGTATAVNAARWHGRTGWHRDRFVKTGDPLTIWVDRDGNPVDAPAPTSRAGVEAVGVALAAWQTVIIVVAGGARWTHSRLDRRRDAAWERDIQSLIDDAGGRTNRQP
jgi:hypothetical protein